MRTGASGPRGTPAPPAQRAAARRARWGVSIVFVALGTLSGSFAARVPALKGQLHLDAGELGTALLGPALGCVLAAPVTGAVLRRLAPRTWIVAGLVPFGVALPLTISVGGGVFGLFAVLTGWGLGAGCVDIAMNTEATRVEGLAGKRIMSGFHGSYSLGALAGAASGALCAWLAVADVTEWAVTAAIVVAVAAMASRWLPAGRVERRPVGPAGRGVAAGGRPSLPVAGVVLLCLVALCAFLSEGAVNDWSAVYLHSSLGATPAVAALGYAAFEATMIGGRLSGDRLTTRWRPSRVVRAAASVGAAGLGAALLVGTVPLGIVGFALLGLGLAVTVPLAVTAAGTLGGGGTSVAAVVACGYLGMLTGPPVVGFVAQQVGVRTALAIVVALVAVIVVLAGRLDTQPQGTPAAATGVLPVTVP